MAAFDLIIKGGTVATGSDVMISDVGIIAGRIAALGCDLGSAETVIDAAANWCCRAASTATSISPNRVVPTSCRPTISRAARDRRCSAATPR